MICFDYYVSPREKNPHTLSIFQLVDLVILKLTYLDIFFIDHVRVTGVIAKYVGDSICPDYFNNVKNPIF